MELTGNAHYRTPMTGSILYCGDTNLDTAAAYLGGLLHVWGVPFDYIPSDVPLQRSDLDPPRRLVILSDYPAERISLELHQCIQGMVRHGTGLLMIGGWESFHGLGGDWDSTPLGEILPVSISQADDRLNSDQPIVLRAGEEHPITRGLPWENHPPYIGGLNRFGPRSDAKTILTGDRLGLVRQPDGQWQATILETIPVLVVGEYEQGRTAALATDVAPHWVGGLVDWGEERVTGQAPGAEAIEVGNFYAQFFQQLIEWTSGE